MMITRKTAMVATATTVALTLTLWLKGADAQCLTSHDDLTSVPPYHDISGMINFDLNLLKELYAYATQEQNIFFSPYSIWNSLLLLYLGSEGRTKEQMEEVLGLTDKMTALKTWRVLQLMYKNRLKQSNSDIFVIANRAYIDPKISINPCIADLLYDELESIDFNQIWDASKHINQFIYDRTSGRIPHLVQAADLQQAVMVLANAAAFKGTWHIQFDPKDTTQEKFYTSPEEYTSVPMMRVEGMFKYGISREIHAQFLELPYADGLTSMYLILPGVNTDADLGLADLIYYLTPDKLSSALKHMWHQDVSLKMPKFELDYSVKGELKAALHRLGMRDLFTNLANLTTLAPFGGLKVSQSLHQATLEVNEEGAEASAATIFITASRTKPPPPAVFECNRPFLLIIYDNNTGNILFMGVYRSPQN